MKARVRGADPKELKAFQDEQEKLVRLWKNPDFQWWIGRIEGQIEKLEQSQWVTDATEARAVMKEMGVAEIEAVPDLLALFLCTRAVVRSWKVRVKPLREAEDRLRALLEKQIGR